MNKLCILKRKATTTAKKPVVWIIARDSENSCAIGDIFAEYAIQVSYRFVIRALKTVFQNSGDTFIYHLYCQAIDDSNNYFAMDIQNEIRTVMKEHTRKKDRITGKMIECKPYYTQELVYDSAKELDYCPKIDKTKVNREVNHNSSVDALVSACYQQILELYHAKQIVSFSDIQLNKGTLYSAINKELYINRKYTVSMEEYQKQVVLSSGNNDDESYSETITTEKRYYNRMNKLSDEIIVSTLEKLVKEHFPKTDTKACVSAIMLYGAGYSQERIAIKLSTKDKRFTQQQIARFISYGKRLVTMPETRQAMTDLILAIG